MGELHEPIGSLGMHEGIEGAQQQLQTSVIAQTLKLATQIAPTQLMSEMTQWITKESIDTNSSLKRYRQYEVLQYAETENTVQQVWNEVGPDMHGDCCKHAKGIDYSTSVLEEHSLLNELMTHLQSLLLAVPCTFSGAERSHILKEALQMAQEEGLVSLGQLLFLIDHQPERLMQCVAEPHFSKQHLHLWVKEQREKTLHKAIEESIAQDSRSTLCLSDRMAKTAATLLMTRVGLCNVGLLECMPLLLCTGYLVHDSNAAQLREWLEQRVCLLIELPQLRQQLQGLVPANDHTVGDACIRETWHLSKEAILTPADARKTLLAAFFSHVRQQEGEEDCFVMALIISVMEESPLQAMEDLRTLLTQGLLKRLVEGKEVLFPWIQEKQEQSDRILPLQRAWRRVVGSMSEAPEQGICGERLLASMMPVFQELQAPEKNVQNTLRVLLSEYFRWMYDPQVSKQGPHKGAFCLYRTLGNGWKKIENEKEFIEALEQFTSEKWPDNGVREEKRTFLHAKLLTEGMFLSFVNDYRARFQVTNAAKGIDLSQLHCTPWATSTRGNAHSVWHTYYEEKVTCAGSARESEAINPKTGENLLQLLVNWLHTHLQARPGSSTSRRQLVRIEDVHAFALLPHSQLMQLPMAPDLLKGWIENNLKAPIKPISQMPSQQIRQGLIRLVGQFCVVPSYRSNAEQAMRYLSTSLSLVDLRCQLVTIALQGQPKGSSVRREEIENRIDSWVIQLLSPQERALLEAHTVMIGDSNWSDRIGSNRYLYLAMHPATAKLTLFLGDLQPSGKEGRRLSPLPSTPWLSARWQILNVPEAQISSKQAKIQ